MGLCREIARLFVRPCDEGTVREDRLVPAHLVPNGSKKAVRSVRQVKSGMTGEVMEHVGDNGFSYGDDGAITRNFEAIMQISMHK